MEFTRGWRLAVAIVLLCASATAEGGSQQQVQVLVYDHARIPAGLLEQAGREAVRIFKAAGIELQWANCSGAGERCPTQSDRDKLVLNVIPKGKTASESVYGETFLGRDGKGSYADIFFTRIEQVHRESGVTESRVLGAVAAHEIGHLLLGLGAHSWLGIMAPRWSSEQIRQLEMGRLLFTPRQADRMKGWISALVLAQGRASANRYASGKNAFSSEVLRTNY